MPYGYASRDHCGFKGGDYNYPCNSQTCFCGSDPTAALRTAVADAQAWATSFSGTYTCDAMIGYMVTALCGYPPAKK